MRLPINEFLKASADNWDQSNAGTNWKPIEDTWLREWVNIGYRVDFIAAKLKRSRESILARLRLLSIVQRNSYTGAYKYVVDDKEEEIMNPDNTCKMASISTPVPPLLETRVYVNGRIASDMTDEEIFAAIRKAEVTIASYNDMVTKPEKLKAMLVKLQNDITELAKYVDQR